MLNMSTWEYLTTPVGDDGSAPAPVTPAPQGVDVQAYPLHQLPADLGVPDRVFCTPVTALPEGKLERFYARRGAAQVAYVRECEQGVLDVDAGVEVTGATAGHLHGEGRCFFVAGAAAAAAAEVQIEGVDGATATAPGVLYIFRNDARAAVPLPFAPTQLLHHQGRLYVAGGTHLHCLTSPSAVHPLLPPQHSLSLKEAIVAVSPCPPSAGSGVLSLDAAGTVRMWAAPLSLLPSTHHSTEGSLALLSPEAHVVPMPAASAAAAPAVRVFPASLAAGGRGAVWVLRGTAQGLALSLLPLTQPTAGGAQDFAFTVELGAAVAADAVSVLPGLQSAVDVLYVPAAEVGAAPLVRVLHEAEGGVRVEEAGAAPLFAAALPAAKVIGAAAVAVEYGDTASAFVCFDASGAAALHEVVSQETRVLRAIAHAPNVFDDAAVKAAVAAIAEVAGEEARAPAGGSVTLEVRRVLDFLLRTQRIDVVAAWVERKADPFRSSHDLVVVRTLLIWLQERLAAVRDEAIPACLAQLNEGPWSLEEVLLTARLHLPQLIAVVEACDTLRPSDANAPAHGGSSIDSGAPDECHSMMGGFHVLCNELWALSDQVDALTFLRTVLFEAGDGAAAAPARRNADAARSLEEAATRIEAERRAAPRRVERATERTFGNFRYVMKSVLRSIAGDDADAAAAAGSDARVGCREATVSTLHASWTAVRTCLDTEAVLAAQPSGLLAKLDLVGGLEAAMGETDAAAVPDADKLLLSMDVLACHGTLDACARGPDGQRGVALRAGGCRVVDVTQLFGPSKQPKVTVGCKVDLDYELPGGYLAGDVHEVNEDDTVDVQTGDGVVHRNVSVFSAHRKGLNLVHHELQRTMKQGAMYYYLLVAFGPRSPLPKRYRTLHTGFPAFWGDLVLALYHSEFEPVATFATRPLTPLTPQQLLHATERDYNPYRDDEALACEQHLMGDGFPPGPQYATPPEVRDGMVACVRRCVDDVCRHALLARWSRAATTADDAQREEALATLADSIEVGLCAGSAAAASGAAPPGCSGSPAVYARSGVSLGALLHITAVATRDDAGVALDLARSLRVGHGVMPALLAVACLTEQRDLRQVLASPLGVAEEVGLYLAFVTLGAIQARDRGSLAGGAAHADTAVPLASLLHASHRHTELYRFCREDAAALRAPRTFEPLLAHLEKSLPPLQRKPVSAAASAGAKARTPLAYAEAMLPNQLVTMAREPQSVSATH